MDIQIQATQGVTKRALLYIRADDMSGPVTGLTFASFSPIYARRENSAAFSVILSGVTFTEVDAVNMPGFYEFTMSDTLLGTLGEIVFSFPKVGAAPASEEVVLRVEVLPALAAVDLSEVVTDLDEIKGAGFDTLTDALRPARVSIEASLTTLGEDLTRALGLAQENFTITGHVYDGEGNLTQSTVTIYPSRDDLILDQNAISTYTMLAAYDGSNRLTNYSVRRDP